MGQHCDIDVSFYRLSEGLGSRFASLSCLTVSGNEADAAFDVMHPEWSSMRMVQRGTPAITHFVGDEPFHAPAFTACGPNCRSIRFGFYEVRIWTIIIRPLGWALHCNGSAADVADRMEDGMAHPAWSNFRGLQEMIQSLDTGPDETARRINAFLLALKPATLAARPQITALHDGLRNPEIGDVEELAESVGVSRRTLERVALRYFGFSPKLLLRRQRFLRSVASFMLMGRENWSEAIDRGYFDQAHFVRDFKRFMGITPSEYAEMPHPIMDQVMAQRMADLGAAPQTDSVIPVDELAP